MTDPPQFSCHLTGCFEYSDGQIAGWARNTIDPRDRDRSLLVAVVRGRHVIGSISVNETASGTGWRFAIEIGSQVSGSDILYERVRVLVRDALGGVQALRPEGATQLRLIRELVADAAEYDRTGRHANQFRN